MTPTEVSLIVDSVGTVIAAAAAVGAVVLGWRNGRKLDVVHKTTNSMSERGEAMAKKLGVEEGKKEQKDNQK